MTTQNRAPVAPKINLTHRINSTCKPLDQISHFDLTDGIANICTRADCAISLLQYFISADEGAALQTINPDILYFHLESIRHDLLDLVAIGETLRGMK